MKGEGQREEVRGKRAKGKREEGRGGASRVIRSEKAAPRGLQDRPQVPIKETSRSLTPVDAGQHSHTAENGI